MEICPMELLINSTFYRFLNCSQYNWSKRLLLLMTKMISFVNSLTSDERKSVLIFDDSLYNRNRSKKVELLTRVFDHTTHKFVKGFRMLTMGWSDGNTFLPVGFSLLSSQNPQKNSHQLNIGINALLLINEEMKQYNVLPMLCSMPTHPIRYRFSLLIRLDIAIGRV